MSQPQTHTYCRGSHVPIHYEAHKVDSGKEVARPCVQILPCVIDLPVLRSTLISKDT